MTQASYTEPDQVIQAYAQANQGTAIATNPLGSFHCFTCKTQDQQSVTAPKPPTTPATRTLKNNTSDTKQFEEYCPPTPLRRKSAFDPRQPFMSYTRLFDGSDAALVANLRDYLEVSGDRRSGGWEAYLHRSEDFIRFTSHLMILEMLTLHGGQAKHQMIFKVRKYR